MTEPLRTLRTAWDIWRTGRTGEPTIASRQRARLPELVTFARERSPCYRRLYKGLPARITDVRQLPVVTKPELMENFDEWVTDPEVTREDVGAFVADESLVGSPYLGRYLVATTSGTTGDPAIFLHDEAALAVYNAIGYVRAMPALLSRHELRRLLLSGARAAAIYATRRAFLCRRRIGAPPACASLEGEDTADLLRSRPTRRARRGPERLRARDAGELPEHAGGVSPRAASGQAKDPTGPGERGGRDPDARSPRAYRGCVRLPRARRLRF